MGENRNIYNALRVLTVDDHQLMRRLVNNTLTDLGTTEIDAASSGKDALHKIHESFKEGKPYNIVFLDWHMPDLDGFSVLTKCRESDYLDDMAIVMLTAESEERNIIRALEAGATSYLVKPASHEDIEKTFNKIIKWLSKRGVIDGGADVLTKNEKEPQRTSAHAVSSSIPKDIIDELCPVVKAGVKSVFSDLFKVLIIAEELQSVNLGKELICVGTLRQKEVTITLRFFFDETLLRPILEQLYSQELLTENSLYNDAACEIVNILCGQIKASLNRHGYSLVLEGATMDDIEHINLNDETFLNLRFSLNDAKDFYIDMAAG